MKQTKKGFSLIYVFFLITITLFFWIVILNKQSYFEKNLEFTQIQDILSKNISTQADISINYNLENNQNNWLYIPVLSCPEEVSFFSWSTLLSTWTTIFEDNFCSWTLNNELLNIFYTWSYTNFWSWILSGSWFELVWTNTLTWNLNPYYVSFEKSTLYDDRYIKVRIEKSWIILKNTWWQNIFWNNTQINDFILSNTNNKEPFLKLWNTSSWVLYFDISDSFSWKIIEFDKNMFDTHKKLLKIDEINFENNWWIIWYLQNDFSFSWSIWTPKYFDFQNKDYAIFLSYNTWSLENIRYTLKVFNQTWTWIYINPIKDDIENQEYLWNNIFLKDWIYYSQIQKIINY